MIKEIAKILISLYKILISPLLPSVCRFYPSCSEYAHSAFSTRTTLTAFYLTLRRLSRCHPFSDGGYDPVPLSTHKISGTKTRSLFGEEVF